MSSPDDLYFIDSNKSSDEEANSLVSLYQQVKENWDHIPVKDLVSRSLINEANIADVIAFVSTADNTQNLFRKAESNNQLHGSIWASIINNKAHQVEASCEIPNFELELIDDLFLEHIRNLSQAPELVAELPDIFLNVGIILIYEPTIKSSLIDGVVGKTITGRPYIGMSLRHYRLDNFWFTLFHELGHICLHLDYLETPILDSDDFELTSEIEIEADIFAKNTLIPRSLWNRSPLKFGQYNNLSEVNKLAKQIGIHPAIVAGRIRKERDNYKIHSKLVTGFNTRSIVWGEN